MDESVQEIVLENGFQIVTKHNPYALSVSAGVFVKASLAEENSKENGIAHFLEHMSFKGTENYSAKKIAQTMDAMGGVMNAHTTKEYTAYFITVLPDKLFKGLDILAEIFLRSTLKEPDIDLERQVVLEEIHMYEDMPDDQVHDLFTQALWETHFLGKPIIGNKKSLECIGRQALLKYKSHYFDPKRLIISIAGYIPDQGKLIKKVAQLFDLPPLKKDFRSSSVKAKATSKVSMVKKAIEQKHFCVGVPGLPHNHPKRDVMSVLNVILGGSMSSRLFQKIRENKGYAYSVYSYGLSYLNTGAFVVYAGVNTKAFSPALNIVLKEFKQLKEKPVAKKELEKAKENLKGTLQIGLEKPSSWMMYLARSLFYYQRVRPIQEILNAIDSVTIQDVHALSQDLFNASTIALAGIGPFSESECALSEKEIMQRIL